MQQRHGADAAWPVWALATYGGRARVQADRHRWFDVAGAAALSVGLAQALVTPVPAQAQVSFDGRGGFELRVTMPLR